MKQEEKMLLLQDLCARLPYGVICHYNCVTSYDMMIIGKANAEGELKGIIPLSDGHIGFMVDCDKIDALEGDIKPYLRPMSSITEEESEEFSNMEIVGYSNYDWLNKHHFDYRGLIEKGLALEAPENMYKLKLNNHDTRRKTTTID
jgi:hypothetical protein